MSFFPTLEDIPDQCSSSPCNDEGTVRCEDKKGDFLCHCFTGWTGARCDKGTLITMHSKREYIYRWTVRARAQQRLNFCTVIFVIQCHLRRLWIAVTSVTFVLTANSCTVQRYSFPSLF